MANKQQLHSLVDRLPSTEIEAAARYLEFLLARNNSEVICCDDEARRQYIEGVKRGIAAADRGELIDHQEVVDRIERLLQE